MLAYVILKALTELALMALVGRFLVGLMAGSQRDHNPVWQLLDLLARPPLKITRWVSPKIVLDRHIPFAAFCLTGSVWLIVLQAQIDACLAAGAAAC